MSDIQTAVVGINYLREFGKWVSGLRKDAEVLGRVNEAMVQVGEVQDKLYELREENLKLLEENRQLTDKLKALDIVVVFRAPAYYRKTETGEDGPFCQRCRDVDGRLVRVTLFTTATGKPAATCDQCTIERIQRRT
jgi:hypothetical protein